MATAQALVRELGYRLGDFWLAAPTGGTTTTLIDTTLRQVLPNDTGSSTAPYAAWVYGATDADVSNRGAERRVSTWTQSTGTLTFLAAWPVAITTGHYEIHQRYQRSRILEALNSGVRQLGRYWYRPMLDEVTLVTAVNTWQYTLPTTINWQGFDRFQIQVNTDNTLTGYPYVDGEQWNAAVIPFTDNNGNTTWRLQFGTLPPPNRIVRVFGHAISTDLVNDTDILSLFGPDAGVATEWLYRWATAMLYRWESSKQPANMTQWLEQQVQILMTEAQDLRDRLSRNVPSLRMILPGEGTGEFPSPSLVEDPAYLAAFRTLH